MGEKEAKNVEAIVERLGRDEMNLAEFPIGVLGHRSPSNVKTLEFQKTIMFKGKRLEQKWTVTSTDKHGLPVASDDAVTLELIELSREHDFPKRVPFSRNELLERLGWGSGGKSYTRLSNCLKRLSGVAIYAENAFWDPESRQYVAECKFNIINSYRIFDENKKRRESQGQQSLPFSWFEWSDEMLDSLRKGYIKSIDLHVYEQLESPIGKRLYRFLDKKLGRKPVFEIGVFKLCHTHLGFPKSWEYFSQLSRRLSPQLDELVRVGYLESYSYRDAKKSDEKKILTVVAAEHRPRIIEDYDTLLDTHPAAYFYRQLHGTVEISEVSAKDRQQAFRFIREYGSEDWRDFVDFAIQYRDKNWPEMKTLGGAIQACKAAFLKQREERLARERDDLKLIFDKTLKQHWVDFVEAEFLGRIKAEFPEKFEIFEAELAQTDEHYRRDKIRLECLEDGDTSDEPSLYVEMLRARMRHRYFTIFADTFVEEGVVDFYDFSHGYREYVTKEARTYLEQLESKIV
ncbi:MAG: replication initiator protein A [Sumerlaeia bacterium]